MNSKDIQMLENNNISENENKDKTHLDILNDFISKNDSKGIRSMIQREKLDYNYLKTNHSDIILEAIRSKNIEIVQCFTEMNDFDITYPNHLPLYESCILDDKGVVFLELLKKKPDSSVLYSVFEKLMKEKELLSKSILRKFCEIFSKDGIFYCSKMAVQYNHGHVLKKILKFFNEKEYNYIVEYIVHSVDVPLEIGRLLLDDPRHCYTFEQMILDDNLKYAEFMMKFIPYSEMIEGLEFAIQKNRKKIISMIIHHPWNVSDIDLDYDNFDYLKKAIKKPTILKELVYCNKIFYSLLHHSSLQEILDEYPCISELFNEKMKEYFNNSELDFFDSPELVAVIAHQEKLEYLKEYAIQFCESDSLIKLLQHSSIQNLKSRNEIMKKLINLKYTLKDYNQDNVKLKQLIGLLNDKSKIENIPILEHLFKISIVRDFKNLYSYILNSTSIDPGLDNQFAILVACDDCNIDLVSMLMKYPTVDPSVKNNQCLIEVCAASDIDILKLLLQDPRVNPSDQNNKAIRNCILNDDFEMFSLIYRDRRFNPIDEENLIFVSACAGGKFGNLKIVKTLLSDPRIDISLHDNAAFIAAVLKNGHKMVELLLTSRHCDPTVLNNFALNYALSKNFKILANTLKRDSRVRNYQPLVYLQNEWM